MVVITEGEHTLQDGHKLYTKSWNPDGPPKAKFIFIHGFSDHCNAYYNFFPTLASKSISVFSFDQRGWGRSVHEPSEKGLTGPTSLVLSDLVHVINSQLPSAENEANPNVPVFIMGHSMGGAEVITLASSPDPEHVALVKRIRGWMTESAHIAFPPESQPSKVQIFLGRLVAPILPKFPMASPLQVVNLTENVEAQEVVANDKLAHGTGTLQGLAGLLERAEAIRAGKRPLNQNGETVKSLWMVHGTVDKCTLYEASKKYLDEQVLVKDRTFKSYEGVGHQIHADTEEARVRFAEDVAQWILARS